MKLRARQFEFIKYNYDSSGRKLSFHYGVYLADGSQIKFAEHLSLPQPIPGDKLTNEITSRVLQSLHLALGVSYFKTFCPPKISIKNFTLSREQAEFWNNVYEKGLGEFFFQNKIDFRGLIAFPFESKFKVAPLEMIEPDRSLVALGGGKDSLVTVELLKKTKKPFSTFTLGDYPFLKSIVVVAGGDNLVVKRKLDPKLLPLSKSGIGYHGHVPISSIYAFVSLFLAVLYNYRYLIFSNENSASAGNVEYLGRQVNHQWSKSLGFERMFSNYIHNFITLDIDYFSLLRPLYELEIVRRFVNFPQYFRLFGSCNTSFRTGEVSPKPLWCGQCPKCAFIFICLSAFLPKDKVVEIFEGQNLLARPVLSSTYRELLGLTGYKPFDCVGTPEETRLAFFLAHKKSEYKKEPIMQIFERELLPNMAYVDSLKRKILSVDPAVKLPVEFGNLL